MLNLSFSSPLTEKEKEVQEFIRCWDDTANRIFELRRKIKILTINITTCPSLSGVSGGYNTSNPTEKYALRKISMEMELEGLVELVKWYNLAIEEAGLSEAEKGVITQMREGNSLLEYARRKQIYCSHVYKIKDRAIKKIYKYLVKTTKRDLTKVKC